MATSETIKNFKFWETDQVGVKSTKVFEVLTMTEIEKMGDTYYFIAQSFGKSVYGIRVPDDKTPIPRFSHLKVYQPWFF